MRTVYFALLLLFSFSCYAIENSEDPDGSTLVEESNNLDILAGDPETFVYRCVNVATGDYIDIQTDLTIPGADPLELTRFYSSADERASSPFQAWKFNHDISAFHPVKGSKS